MVLPNASPENALDGYEGRPNYKVLAPTLQFPLSENAQTLGMNPNSQKYSGPAPAGAALNPVQQLTADLKMASTPAAKANVVLEALADAKENPALSQKIVDVAMKAMQGPENVVDRVETIGALMKNHANLVMNTDQDALKVSGANLLGVSYEASQALPFNRMDIRNTIFKADLNLQNNEYMGGAGVNFDGVVMPRANLPANLHVISAQDAQLDQAPTQTAAVLSFAGAQGQKATWSFDPNSNAVTDVAMALSNETKISPDGKLLQNNKTTPQQWAGIASDPSPFGA